MTEKRKNRTMSHILLMMIKERVVLKYVECRKKKEIFNIQNFVEFWCYVELFRLNVSHPIVQTMKL